MSSYIENAAKEHLEKLNDICKRMGEIVKESPAIAPEQDFFAKYGQDQVSLNGWLGEPKFTVEEFADAIVQRIRSQK